MERDTLAGRFETHRALLRAVAYRMLGSLSDADDAVQETWLRLSRTDVSEIEDLGGWLRQVVSRICLDMLRAQKARREDTLEDADGAPALSRPDRTDPEREAIMADEVGLALLVVMERLDPAERLALVLHDMFAVPFDEIAPIVERSPAAARQLASRARRRVHGDWHAHHRGDEAEALRRGQPAASCSTDRHQQRAVIDAFLAAARAGDLPGVLAVLDPDVVFRTSAATGRQEVQGAQAVAPLAMRGRAVAARPLLVNGNVGVVVAPRGRLMMVLEFTIRDARVLAIEAVTQPLHMATVELAILD